MGQGRYQEKELDQILRRKALPGQVPVCGASNQNNSDRDQIIQANIQNMQPPLLPVNQIAAAQQLPIPPIINPSPPMPAPKEDKPHLRISELHGQNAKKKNLSKFTQLQNQSSVLVGGPGPWMLKKSIN